MAGRQTDRQIEIVSLRLQALRPQLQTGADGGSKLQHRLGSKLVALKTYFLLALSFFILSLVLFVDGAVFIEFRFKQIENYVKQYMYER